MTLALRRTSKGLANQDIHRRSRISFGANPNGVHPNACCSPTTGFLTELKKSVLMRWKADRRIVIIKNITEKVRCGTFCRGWVAGDSRELVVASEHSITTWIGKLREGDSVAARLLWERYFARLVTVARERLHGTSRRAADEEDVALSAFHSFCRSVEHFPRLDNRQDLWQVLVMLTARKAYQERRRQQTRKRGGTHEAGGPRCAEAVSPQDWELDQIIGDEPDPQFTVMLAERLETLSNLLPDETLRLIVRMRLEGYTSAEVATNLGCTERTVERKLVLIRSFWEKSMTP